MLIDSAILRLESVKGIIPFNKNLKGSLWVILIKNSLIEIVEIDQNFKLKILHAWNFNKNIIKTTVLCPKSRNNIHFLIYDNKAQLSILQLNRNLEASIISSKKLDSELTSDKAYFIFLLTLKNPYYSIISTTDGKKIFFKLRIDKKGSFRFSNHGSRIIQKSLICYYATTLENYFVSIECHSKLPYSRFLVFYKLDKKGILEKKIFSRVSGTSYKIIQIPKNGNENENLVILFKGGMSIINFKTKLQILSSIPLKKSKKNYLLPILIDFFFFNGKNKSLFFFYTKEGDIFKLSSNFYLKPFEKKSYLKISYFDTISSKLKSIKLLTNGILFVTLESGKSLFYRFVSIGKKKNNSNTFFISNYITKNLIIIDQLFLISKTILLPFQDIIQKHRKKIIFFCKVKNNSSLRFLNRVPNVIKLFQKKFILKPFGIYIIKNNQNTTSLVISFNQSTLTFSFFKKIEEINYLEIITDLRTIFIIFSKHLDAIIQITNKTVRLVKHNDRLKKICQWISKLDVFIINTAQNFQGGSYLFLLLSTQKIVMLEITKKDIFVELKSWKMNNLKDTRFLINCYIPKKKNQPKILIIGARKERTIRIYKIFPDLSLVLMGIQLLNWSPESMSFLKKGCNIFFLFGLNNGILLKTAFCQKKNKMIVSCTLNLSSGPLYFPDNFSSRIPIIFGEKVWKLKNIWKKKFQYYSIIDKFYDFFEPVGKFAISIKRKKLNVYIKKTETNFYLNKFEIRCNFKVENFFCIERNSSYFFTIGTDPFLILDIHQMNLSTSMGNKKLNLNFELNGNNNNVSSISVLKFLKKTPLRKNNAVILNNLFKLKTASDNFSLVSILKKKSYNSSKYIFFLSKISNWDDGIDKKGVISVLNEFSNQTITVMVVLLKGYSKFISSIGGKYKLRLRLNFVFEIMKNYQFSGIPMNAINKSIIGSRVVLSYENEIRIFEIAKETAKNIKIIDMSMLTHKKLQTIGNKIYVVEELDGVKVFTFSKKYGKVKGLKIIWNSLIRDFFLINPLFSLLSDVLGNLYIYGFNISHSNFSQKKKKESWKVKSFLKIQEFENVYQKILSKFNGKYLFELIKEYTFFSNFHRFVH